MDYDKAVARVQAAEEAVSRHEGEDEGDYTAELENDWRRTPLGEARRALARRKAELSALG